MKKENIPLLLGLFIPVVLIFFVGVSIYVPTLLTQPKYNFIYVAGGDYYLLDGFAVQNNKVIKRDINYPPNYSTQRPPIEPKLFLCNVRTNTSTEVSFEEAQKLRLSSDPMSPDGFEVSSGSDNYSIFSLLTSRSSIYGEKYIRGHGISKRLNLRTEEAVWYHNFRFMGWVM